jgi:two-component system sensor histidine kinase TctE
VTRPGSPPEKASSLRIQLLLWLLLPVLAAVAAMSGVSYYFALDAAEDDFDQTLLGAAREIAHQVKRGPGGPALDLPDAAREMLEIDFDDRMFFRVVDARGSTIAGERDLPLPSRAPEPGAVRFYDTAIQGLAVRVAALTLATHDREPPLTVLVGETLSKRNDLTWDLMITVLAPEVILVLLVTVLVWFGVKRGLAPLLRIADALRRRGWQDLRRVNNLGVPAEARPLTDALNDLMTRLQTAQESQQRFIADAAHQLRTPLAGLLAQADRVLHESDLEAIRPAMRQLQASSRRLARLVNQLLLLARADADLDVIDRFRPVDLAALIRQTCGERVPEALARRVDLGYAGEDEALMIAGDEFLLREMLNNLIDNALQYGGSPGRVTVRLQRTPLPVLSVEDTGPGVPEAAIPHIFDRFRRAAESPPGGSGLGLSIVREIAQMHGATVAVGRLTPRGGAVFRVTFGAQLAVDEPPQHGVGGGRAQARTV